MVLYLRSAGDLPHAQDPTLAGVTKCGLSLTGAKPINELQAQVFYRDQRCSVCFPFWATHTSHTRSH